MPKYSRKKYVSSAAAAAAAAVSCAALQDCVIRRHISK